MNALWAGMMLMAIIYGTFHGTIPAVTQAALDSAKEAVSLCITMLGILSFWMGLMQVGSASGLIGRMTRGIRPALRWSVSGDSGRSSGSGADCCQLYCERTGAWLGGNSGGLKSHGRTVSTGRGSAQRGY